MTSEAVEVTLAHHEEQIGQLKETLSCHEDANEKEFESISKNFAKVFGKLEEIKDQYSNRLPNWASVLVAVLMGLLGLLGGLKL